MDIKIYNQKDGVDKVPSEATQIAEENRAVDKQEREDDRTVAELVKKSNRILATVSTHGFPFDPFPDTINIEEGRVTIITRTFFLSSRVHSVDIKDVSNVFVNVAPFFAQLVIVSKTFAANEIKINNLRKDDAVFARRIIEGLRTFVSKQIDTSTYSVKELVAKLQELSTTEIVT